MHQQPAQQPARDSEKARYNLFTMEGVLERAVEQGANQLRRQVQRRRGGPAELRQPKYGSERMIYLPDRLE